MNLTPLEIAVKYVYGNNDALSENQEVKDIIVDIENCTLVTELLEQYNEAIEALKGSQQVIEWLVVNGEFQPEHFETLHNSTQNQLNEIIELTYKHES